MRKQISEPDLTTTKCPHFLMADSQYLLGLLYVFVQIIMTHCFGKNIRIVRKNSLRTRFAGCTGSPVCPV